LSSTATSQALRTNNITDSTCFVCDFNVDLEFHRQLGYDFTIY